LTSDLLESLATSQFLGEKLKTPRIARIPQIKIFIKIGEIRAIRGVFAFSPHQKSCHFPKPEGFVSLFSCKGRFTIAEWRISMEIAWCWVVNSRLGLRRSVWIALDNHPGQPDCQEDGF